MVFLWAGAFINHPQKKQHSTTTLVGGPCFFPLEEKEQNNWKKKGGGGKSMRFFNQSNQLWSTSVSRSLMHQVNTRLLCGSGLSVPFILTIPYICKKLF